MPAWTSTRSPGCTGPTSRVLTVSIPDAVRTVASSSSLPTTSPRRPSSEQTTHAVLLVVDGLEEPRVLEADVGELPEDVVAEHEATVVAGGRDHR